MGGPTSDKQTPYCVQLSLTALRTAREIAEAKAKHQLIRLPRNNGPRQNNEHQNLLIGLSSQKGGHIQFAVINDHATVASVIGTG